MEEQKLELEAEKLENERLKDGLKYVLGQQDNIIKLARAETEQDGQAAEIAMKQIELQRVALKDLLNQ